MRIGLVYDLRNDYLKEGFTEEQVAEFDSEATIDAIEQTIRSLGHVTDRIGHGRSLCARLVKGDRWDMVFNFAEGVRGRSREAQVPGLLEMYGVPYTFSDPLVCSVTLDKAIAKRLVQSAGLRTPEFRLVESESDLAAVNMPFPLFAKPVAEGTGKGVDARSCVKSAADLREVCLRLLAQFHQPVLVEEYLPGREFTTGVLGTGPEARVLGTMEVRIRSGAPAADYSYEVKERCEEFVEYRPLEAGLLRESVEALVLSSHRTLQCRDASRVDVRVDRLGQPAFVEVNPLPGLHPHHSDLPMIATQEGMAYRDLLGAIIRSAAARCGGGA
jgi:D-alanine-D-alanine ligase